MKQLLLDIAEVLDAYRVFPRVLIIIFMLMLWDAHSWFIALKAPINEQQLYLNVMWGAMGAITGFYVASGRKWQ